MLFAATALPICTKISISQLPRSISVASRISLSLFCFSLFCFSQTFLRSSPSTRVRFFFSRDESSASHRQPGDYGYFFLNTRFRPPRHPQNTRVLVSTSSSHVSRQSKPRSTLPLTTETLVRFLFSRTHGSPHRRSRVYVCSQAGDTVKKKGGKRDRETGRAGIKARHLVFP